MTNTDPQAAADAAAAWLDGYDRSHRSDSGPRNGIVATRWTDDTPDLTVDVLRALLADRVRMKQEGDEMRTRLADAQTRLDYFDSRVGAVHTMAFLESELARTKAELEQVRSDWLTQTAQLNRIAGIVGHALIVRACDDATLEEVRLAQARACEDVHGVIGESEAARAQRTERYFAMCTNLLNDHVLRERDGLAERGAHLLAALTVAAELIDRLADGSVCDPDYDRHRRTHGHHMPPCPHPLGRRFVEAWDAVVAETTATRPADGTAGMMPGGRV